MKVATRQEGTMFHFRLDLLPDDSRTGTGQFNIEVTSSLGEFRVAHASPIERPHPDLVGLAALAAVRPWSRRLHLVDPVSAQFANAVESELDIEVSPVDPGQSPRGTGTRTAILYSGGPDSMAMDLLIGPGPLLHMVRVPHRRVPNRMTHVRGDVLRRLVDTARRRGDEVHFHESDLEFVVLSPYPTWPHWAGLTIGGVLAADHLDLSAIAFGRTLNGMYLGRGRGFNPLGDSEDRWIRIFAATGIDLLMPLGGLSEVTTMRLARQHRNHDLSRSCLLGGLDGPCLRCVKCLFKELIRAYVDGVTIPRHVTDRLGASPAVAAFLTSGDPSKRQYLLEFLLTRVDGIEGTVYATLKKRLRPEPGAVSWVDRHYVPALDLLPAGSAELVARRLGEHGVVPMPVQEYQEMESWRPRKIASRHNGMNER